MPQQNRDLLAFSHVPKAAGTTINHLLHRHFGYYHVGVQSRQLPTIYAEPIYTERDLRLDLKLHPFAKSLAGHSLRPFVGFGEYESRLRWYTFLREPVSRFISLYQYQINKGLKEHLLPFREWMRVLNRQNWMVQWMAGEQDVEAAKQILSEKIQFVGLVEHFNESLLLMRHRLGLDGFNVDYPTPANMASSNTIRKHIQEHFEEYREEVTENNVLDIELYNFALKEIWPRQLADYGEARLAQDVEREFRQRLPSTGARCRRASYRAYRNLVYKPFLYIDRKYLASKSVYLSAFKCTSEA